MKSKKLVAVLASVAVLATLFAGCGGAKKDENANTGKKEKAKAEVKIGLSTDEGGLNDKSFNQAADKGIKKAVDDFKVKYKPIESHQKEDYEPNLQALSVDENSDLTFGVGFNMQKALENVAKENTDKKYAIVDAVVEAPNVQSLLFKEEEGSFLIGAIAAKTSKTNKIGFIGGIESAVIGRFESGYIAGARAVNPDIKIISKYADSFSDTNKGYEIAKSEYNEGCDVVFHAAGGVGLGLFKATNELKKSGKEVWAIGVDEDQAVTVSEYKNVILTSMVKRVDIATYEAVKEIVDGKFEGGKTKVFGIKENAVGVADSSRKTLPKDVLKLADDYAEKIKKGEIKVPDKVEKAKTFKLK